jgi:hypothetical protein
MWGLLAPIFLTGTFPITFKTKLSKNFTPYPSQATPAPQKPTARHTATMTCLSRKIVHSASIIYFTSSIFLPSGVYSNKSPKDAQSWYLFEWFLQILPILSFHVHILIESIIFKWVNRLKQTRLLRKYPLRNPRKPKPSRSHTTRPFKPTLNLSNTPLIRPFNANFQIMSVSNNYKKSETSSKSSLLPYKWYTLN